MKKTVWLLALNTSLTIAFCFLLGPAAYKLDRFGMIGWAARSPFYLLHFYIGPMVFIFAQDPKWLRKSVAVGFFIGMPLAFWAYSTGCPTIVPFIRISFCIFHAGVMAWAIRKAGPLFLR